MNNTGKLAGRTIFITGASRGIGKAIALKAAQDGANIVIAAKTAEPHPKLPGTIYSAAEEIEKAGGKALPCIVDVRDEQQIRNAVRKAVEKFGGIDILVNNASAISLTGTLMTDMKRYDLMHNINTRGTFLVSKECLPHLKKSNHAHILNISPPLDLNPVRFKDHVAYTMAKAGMSMCVLGMSSEFKDDNISVNALWPRTAVYTAAVEMLVGPESLKFSRKPEIMADAAYAILCREPRHTTGNFFYDDDILRNAGIIDLRQYSCDPTVETPRLLDDLFVDDDTKSSTKASGEGATSGGGQIERLFAKIEGLLREQRINKTNAVYQFNVTGEEKGTWFLDLKNGNGKCGKGEASLPDAIITMDSEHFANMFAGNLEPAAAYMNGKLTIIGGLQIAMQLDKMLGDLKSKL